MKIEIEAPYGNKIAEGDSIMQCMIEHCIDQLNFFQKQKDTEEIQKDLAGYKELLSASENTIRHFLDLKHQSRIGKRKYKWNDDLVKEIKDTGDWVPR